MKLLNQSIKFITLPMLLIISLWGVVFYFSIYREIKKSVDEGLDNYKRQIVYQAQTDSTILQKDNFADGFFAVRKINETAAQGYKDTYRDTLMYMQDADDLFAELEPARLLSTAFELESEYYELKVIHSMIEEDDLVKALSWNILWLFLALFLTTVVINNFVLKRLWKPFYAFLSHLKFYRLGSEHNLPKIKTKTREFNDLQHAVDTLLKHNTIVYEQQKQFIGNASHELQTPLAIAINKLELLMEKENLNHEQAEILSEIVETIERLVRINKSLLLLSKIENRQFMNNQTVSINEVVRQTADSLEEIAAYKNVKIHLSETQEIRMIMDLSLVHVAVSNLIRNSIFHNIPNGVVQVKISGNKLTVCNTGRREPLDEKQIFTRFYRSQDTVDGTGLGLTIVKAVCDLYGYAIRYQYRQPQHCFEIVFKK